MRIWIKYEKSGECGSCVLVDGGAIAGWFRF
jgi:hypothetical protein